MNIAILGGAFDPPHFGHILVASQVKELLKMDEVWLMPCYSYFPEFPVKFSHITQPDTRFTMTSLHKEKDIRLSDFEFKYNKRSRTVDTMQLLKKYYPKDNFSFIIGSDTLPGFHLWDSWKELIQNEKIIVFPRDTDFKTLKKRVLDSFHISSLTSNITVVEGDLVVSNIASTHIRKRVRAGLSISHMVFPAVEKYIYQNKLYRI